MSARVVTLTTGVLKAMYLQKLVPSVTALALVALVAVGWTAYVSLGAPATPAAQKKEAPEAKAEDATINMQLLTHRKVIRELKCTEEQWDRIDDALENAQKRTERDFNAAVQGLQNQPADAVKPDFGKIMLEHQAAAAKEITGKVLLPKQVARLRQIDVQARGPWAFQTPRVEAALKLTDAQKAKVKGLIEEMLTKAKKKAEEGLNKPGNGGGNPAGAVPADPAGWMPDTAPTLKAILKELTAKQAATWKELAGEPVKFDLKKVPAVQNDLIGKMFTPEAFGGNGVVPGLGLQVPPVDPPK